MLTGWLLAAVGGPPSAAPVAMAAAVPVVALLARCLVGRRSGVALASADRSKLERTRLVVGKILKRREKLLTEYTRSFAGGDDDDDGDEDGV